jgi:phytanoyl-CoA hydroxylase
MKSELTPEQIERYQQDGVVVIEGLLDAEELQTCRTHVDAAVADRQDRKLANGDMKSGDSYYDKVFTQRLNLWVDHAGMRGLMLDPRLGRMAAELAGGRRHTDLARPGANQGTMGQPDGLALGQSLLVLFLA